MPAPLRADRSGKLPLSLQSANNSQRGGFLSLSHLGFSSFKVLAITVPLPPPTIGPFVLSRPSLLEMPHSIFAGQSRAISLAEIFDAFREVATTSGDHARLKCTLPAGERKVGRRSVGRLRYTFYH